MEQQGLGTQVGGPSAKSMLVKCFIFKTHVNFTFAPKLHSEKNILDYLAVEVPNILPTNLTVKLREPRSDSISQTNKACDHKRLG